MSVIHFFSRLGYIKMNVMVFGNAVSVYKGDVVTVTVPIKCVKLPSCIVFLSIRFLSLTSINRFDNVNDNTNTNNDSDDEDRRRC